MLPSPLDTYQKTCIKCPPTFRAVEDVLRAFIVVVLPPGSLEQPNTDILESHVRDKKM